MNNNIFLKKTFLTITCLLIILLIPQLIAGYGGCTQDCPWNADTGGCDCNSHTVSSGGGCGCDNGNDPLLCAQTGYPDFCEFCHDFIQTCACEYDSPNPGGFPRCVDGDTREFIESLNQGGGRTCGNLIREDCDPGEECQNGICEETADDCNECGDGTWSCWGNIDRHCGDNGDIGIPFVYNVGSGTCNPNNDWRFYCTGSQWYSCNSPRGTWTWVDGAQLIGGESIGGRCCDPSKAGTSMTEQQWLKIRSKPAFGVNS